MRKKKRAGGITLPDFRLHYKGIVVKTSIVLTQNRNMDYWNRTESPEINSCTYSQSINIWQKRQEYNIQWRKDGLFNKWCWENCTATCIRMKIEHSLTTYTKINSKWIKNLNVRPYTMKLLEENTEHTLT